MNKASKAFARLLANPRHLTLAAAAAITFCSSPAHCATYSFSFVGQTAMRAVGTLTTGAADQGGFQITSVTGQYTYDNGTVELGIQGPSAPGAGYGITGYNDNILYPSGPYLDLYGLTFYVPAFYEWVKISYDAQVSTSYLMDEVGEVPGDGQFDFGTFTITPDDPVSTTPLPAALPMFAGGLGFVGYLTRRRKRNGTQSLAAA